MRESADDLFVEKSEDNKKSILDLPESWRESSTSFEKGISAIKWSPDGYRLLVFSETRLLIVRL